jgi:hypothetical protein
MTVAVCLECGSMKHGAWTVCASCDHEPADPEDLAKHMMLTDHFVTVEKLEELAARRRQGEPWNFDPQLVAVFLERVKATLPERADGAPEKGDHQPTGSAVRDAPTRQSESRSREWWQFWK